MRRACIVKTDNQQVSVVEENLQLFGVAQLDFSGFLKGKNNSIDFQEFDLPVYDVNYFPNTSLNEVTLQVVTRLNPTREQLEEEEKKKKEIKESVQTKKGKITNPKTLNKK